MSGRIEKQPSDEYLDKVIAAYQTIIDDEQTMEDPDLDFISEMTDRMDGAQEQRDLPIEHRASIMVLPTAMDRLIQRIKDEAQEAADADDTTGFNVLSGLVDFAKSLE